MHRMVTAMELPRNLIFLFAGKQQVENSALGVGKQLHRRVQVPLEISRLLPNIISYLLS